MVKRMNKAINYIQWPCPGKRLWSLEPINMFRKCHYKQKNKYGEIVCENLNCDGEFPNQEFRDYLSKIQTVTVK